MGSSPLVRTPAERWPALHAIVDAEVAERAGWEPLALTAAFLDGGATFIQLRAKRWSSARFLVLCDAAMARAQSYRATVIVNDRVDLTMLSGAHGVHVGQEDLSVTQTRRLLGDEAIVGWSTHTPAQIVAAVLLPATYLAVGPVFGTTTKETGYAAVGLEMVRAARRATERPVVAIGGITLDAAPSVLAAGATAVAVIGDLLSAEDPSRRVRQYVDLLRR